MTNLIQFPPVIPSKREFSVIAAVAMNGVIGNSASNTIPWHLPADLKSFKEITQNKTVVMGSRTLESIGKALPNRKNIVITRNAGKMAKYMLDYKVDGCYADLAHAIEREADDLFVIGGEFIYLNAMLIGPRNIYITIVNLSPEGDVKFPIDGDHFNDDVVEFNGHRYECKSRSEWNRYGTTEYQFTRFERA